MSHAFTYQAPYGTFHFSEGLLTVALAEDLIVDLPLMQRVAAQRQELLGDREVAELIVIPRAHLLLDRAALTWMAQETSLAGVHHRAIVVPAHLLVWRDRLTRRQPLAPQCPGLPEPQGRQGLVARQGRHLHPRVAERTEEEVEVDLGVTG